MELWYLRRLLADGIRPDWILAEVWPPYLYQSGAWAEENRIHAARLLHRDLAVLSRYSTKSGRLCRTWYKGQIQPWLTHRIFLLNLYAPDWLPPNQRLDPSWKGLDRWGWLATPEGEPDAATRQQLFSRGRQMLAPALEHFQVGEASNRALRELVALCRQERIGVVLIFLPEASQCRSWYPPAAQTQVDEYLHGLSKESAVPVVNARQWIPDRQFLDGYHLTTNGAASFSEQLEQRVVQPLLTNRPLAAEDVWPPF
jgi:hypothetical protein